MIPNSSSGAELPWWLKVMAFSTTPFHFPQSWTQVTQFLTLIWQMSCLTLSSHLYLDLPCDLLVRGFHLNIFFIVLVSGILCTWPNQLILWALIWLTIFLSFISLSNSSLVLILHIWFPFVGPNILLKNFLSKTSNFWIVVSFGTHGRSPLLVLTFQLMTLFGKISVKNGHGICLCTQLPRMLSRNLLSFSNKL